MICFNRAEILKAIGLKEKHSYLGAAKFPSLYLMAVQKSQVSFEVGFVA